MTIDGADVGRHALVPRPITAWNEIARLTGVADAAALFAQLVTAHAARE